jgi:cell wall-associated NlpC family hydrolase
MNARVERLVEDYNEVREALGRTRAEQARTRRRVAEARRRLDAAKRLLGRRLWVVYTGGAPSALGQLLGAETVHQALTTAKYQERVVGADQAAIERVERLGRELEALAKELAEQRRRQEELRRRALLRRLAAERAARARAAAARHDRPWRGPVRRAGRATGAARQAVAYAMAQIGKPYRWGASGPAPATAPG